MDSIEKQAIQTFCLAAQILVYEWGDELFLDEDQEVNFCAFSAGSSLKIALNQDWTRKNYDVSLQRVLERFDQWATAHASQEQKAYWSDKSRPYVQTCVRVSKNSAHEAIETKLALIEKDPNLAQSLSK